MYCSYSQLCTFASFILWAWPTLTTTFFGGDVHWNSDTQKKDSFFFSRTILYSVGLSTLLGETVYFLEVHNPR